MKKVRQNATECDMNSPPRRGSPTLWVPPTDRHRRPASSPYPSPRGVQHGEPRSATDALRLCALLIDATSEGQQMVLWASAGGKRFWACAQAHPFPDESTTFLRVRNLTNEAYFLLHYVLYLPGDTQGCASLLRRQGAARAWNQERQQRKACPHGPSNASC